MNVDLCSSHCSAAISNNAFTIVYFLLFLLLVCGASGSFKREREKKKTRVPIQADHTLHDGTRWTTKPHITAANNRKMQQWVWERLDWQELCIDKHPPSVVRTFLGHTRFCTSCIFATLKVNHSRKLNPMCSTSAATGAATDSVTCQFL